MLLLVSCSTPVPQDSGSTLESPVSTVDSDSTLDDSEPVSDLTWTTLHAGSSSTCGIKSNGRAACWGGPGFELPDVDDAPTRTIKPGPGFSCRLLEDGTGECITPETEEEPDLSFPSGIWEDFEIAADFGTVCGKRTSGTLECWGWNAGGLAEPVTKAVAAFAVGEALGCAVQADDRALSCWGSGIGVGLEGTTPPAGAFTAVDVAGDHACALAVEGSVSC